jgi:hypothetical protein
MGDAHVVRDAKHDRRRERVGAARCITRPVPDFDDLRTLCAGVVDQAL